MSCCNHDCDQGETSPNRRPESLWGLLDVLLYALAVAVAGCLVLIIAGGWR